MKRFGAIRSKILRRLLLWTGKTGRMKLETNRAEENAQREKSEKISREYFNYVREVYLKFLFSNLYQAWRTIDRAEIYRPKTFDEYSAIHLTISRYWHTYSQAKKWLVIYDDDAEALAEVLELFKSVRGVFYFGLPESERKFKNFLPEAEPAPADRFDSYKIDEAVRSALTRIQRRMKSFSP
jgi:hypothetical protein